MTEEKKNRPDQAGPVESGGLDSLFGRRLVAQREKLGLSQEKLAQKTGLSKNSIQNFEKGRLPAGPSLVALCRELKVSADWLLFGQAVPMGPGDPEPADGTLKTMADGQDRLTPESDLILPLAVETDEPDADLYTLVPLAEAYLSAGGGAFVLSEKGAKLMAFRKDWLNMYATSRSKVVLMGVKGDSMSPTISDGDLVMLDIGRRVIHDGGLYAIGLGDSISIKRLELLVGRRVRVISDNRAEYPPYEVDHGDLRLLGQIIWFARELIK